MLKVHAVVDGRPDAEGVDPRGFDVSWKVTGGPRGLRVQAFRVQIADDPAFRQVRLDTRKVPSGPTFAMRFDGTDLQPGSAYTCRIRVWQESARPSAWSDPIQFFTGLVTEEDWCDALWIARERLAPAQRLVPGIHMPSDDARPAQKEPLPLLRKGFRVRAGLQRALLFISAPGHYQAQMNGRAVGDRFLAPGWTHFDHRLIYNTHDVTDLLRAGRNAIGVELGHGFFNVPNHRYRKMIVVFGKPMVRCMLQLQYDDGRAEVVVSDTSWKTEAGPTRYSSIYGGEDFDARRLPEKWTRATFDDTAWKPALAVDPPCRNLVAERDYPVRLVESFPPCETRRLPGRAARWLYDFGQNASGVMEIAVQGRRGARVRLTPTELIHADGTPNQIASGEPHFYEYTLGSDAPETWHPRFTYYGFRYVMVEGAAPVEAAARTGARILSMRLLHNRNAAPSVGTFQTSFALFNRIHRLIRYAIQSNLQSVVTDCPHREKLGWLEQTWLMGDAIHFNFDVAGLYAKTIDDMTAGQTADGLMPCIAPEYVEFEGGFRDSPEWGSALILVPWLLYRWYGERSGMQRAYPHMVRYVEYLERKSKDGLLCHGLGDWFDLGPGVPGEAQLTPVALTATAVWYRDVVLLATMAGMLGHMADARRFAAQARRIGTSFNRAFLDERTATYAGGSQTALSMPLVFGLVPARLRRAAQASLIRRIEADAYALTPGDVGFHFLVRALQEADRGDVLFRMNARDDVPGYGFQLRKGATALTESWAALESVSNNHMMLGHIMAWFYGGLAGIGQTGDSVAYREVSIVPQVVNGIDSVEASFESPYGRIGSSWRRVDDGVEFDVEVPVGATAQIALPAHAKAKVLEDGEAVEAVSEIRVRGTRNGRFHTEAPSGRYAFKVRTL